MGSKYAKFDHLYQDAKRRQERQEFIYSACVEAECTFKPDTRQTQIYNMKHSSINSAGKLVSNRADVYERLSQNLTTSFDRSKLCLENSKNLTNDLFDPETGQQFFKPQIGRAPRGREGYGRNRSKNLGEDLYREAFNLRERKQ
jgi:hypothetical protein